MLCCGDFNPRQVVWTCGVSGGKPTFGKWPIQLNLLKVFNLWGNQPDLLPNWRNWVFYWTFDCLWPSCGNGPTTSRPENIKARKEKHRWQAVSFSDWKSKCGKHSGTRTLECFHAQTAQDKVHCFIWSLQPDIWQGCDVLTVLRRTGQLNTMMPD